jgi:hypothetical protein
MAPGEAKRQRGQKEEKQLLCSLFALFAFLLPQRPLKSRIACGGPADYFKKVRSISQ